MSEILNNLDETRAVSNLSRKLAKNVFLFNGNERITLLNGGLGNQLCQYFFYRFLECSGKDPVIADNTQFFIYKQHCGYELEKIFGFRIKKLSDFLPGEIFIDMINRREKGESVPEQIYRGGYNISVIAELDAPKFSGSISWMPSYFPTVYRNTGFIYYHIYTIIGHYFNDLRNSNCINPHPFPQIIGEQNEIYASEIKSTESVAMHVRRGDFVAANWSTKPEIFARAVNEFNNKLYNPTFFIFSDDLDYCKEHIEELGLADSNFIFVEGNKYPNNYLDMQLMTMCKHRIVTNSSFDFCAALFREDREGLMINLNPARPIF